MTSPTPEQQFLMAGESVPSAFNRDDGVGTRRGGKIVERPELRQQTDYDDGHPLTWDDGSPRNHLVVTVQGDLRDPSNPDDDGRRRFYVKGNLQRVTRDALRSAGVGGLEVGGQLFVTRIGRDTPKSPKRDGAWLHSVDYVPAAQTFVDPTPAAAAPAPAAGGDGLTAEAFPYLSPEQLAGVQAAGLSAEQVRQMFPAPAA